MLTNLKTKDFGQEYADIDFDYIQECFDDPVQNFILDAVLLPIVEIVGHDLEVTVIRQIKDDIKNANKAKNKRIRD